MILNYENVNRRVEISCGIFILKEKNKKGILVESKSITIERAMIKWIRQVQGSLQIQYGKNIPESEILKVILKQSSNLPKGNWYLKILLGLFLGLRKGEIYGLKFQDFSKEQGTVYIQRQIIDFMNDAFVPEGSNMA